MQRLVKTTVQLPVQKIDYIHRTKELGPIIPNHFTIKVKVKGFLFYYLQNVPETNLASVMKELGRDYRTGEVIATLQR